MQRRHDNSAKGWKDDANDITLVIDLEKMILVAWKAFNGDTDETISQYD